jgi:hypothetical protein
VLAAERSARKKHLRVAYVSPSYSQSINWIAKETGIFSKHGLNVELIYISGESRPKRSSPGALIFLECRTAAGASGFGRRQELTPAAINRVLIALVSKRTLCHHGEIGHRLGTKSSRDMSLEFCF